MFVPVDEIIAKWRRFSWVWADSESFWRGTEIRNFVASYRFFSRWRTKHIPSSN